MIRKNCKEKYHQEEYKSEFIEEDCKNESQTLDNNKNNINVFNINYMNENCNIIQIKTIRSYNSNLIDQQQNITIISNSNKDLVSENLNHSNNNSYSGNQNHNQNHKNSSDKYLNNNYNEYLIEECKDNRNFSLGNNSNNFSEPREFKTNNIYIILLTLNASLCNLYMGFNIGVTDTLDENLIFLYQWDKKDSQFYLSTLTSSLSLGAIFGSLLLGPIMIKSGRRKSLMIVDMIAILGLILMNFLNIYLMITGRFICGIAMGGYCTSIGIYVKEFAPYSLIGKCGSIYELNYCIGIFLSYVFGLNLPEIGEFEASSWWRVILSFPGFFVFFNFVFLLICFKSETPNYLYLIRNDKYRAQRSLESIYFEKSDISIIMNDLEKLSKLQPEQITLMELFSKKYRKRFILVVFLLITEQASGIDAILMYSDSIFIKNVNSKKIATLYTNFIGIFQVLAGISTMIIIEKFGRKVLLVVGQFLLIIFLWSLAYLYYYDIFTPVIYFMIASVYINGTTLSPVSFIYAAEVLPEIGIGIGMALNNFTSFLVTQSFKYMCNSAKNIYGTMLIYSSFLCINLIITIVFLKETRGLSAEKIDRMYSPKKVFNKITK